ncbi:MAG: hypothetical protein M0R03_23295 [Novosphingobium sp.]|nr:hypothetical protein [Novosphingobium sp.]
MKNENKKLFLIAGLVILISLFFVLVQINKSNNERKVEEQKLALEEKEMKFKMEQELKAETDKAYNKILLNSCLEKAEDAYWSYAELNGVGKRYDEDGILMAQYKWDIAEENKEKDIDNCYRKYSN